MSEKAASRTSVHSIVRRPPAICCPECGRVVELVDKACNYPCERCGVLWRWYYRPGMREDIEIQKEKR